MILQRPPILALNCVVHTYPVYFNFCEELILLCALLLFMIAFVLFALVCKTPSVWCYCAMTTCVHILSDLIIPYFQVIQVYISWINATVPAPKIQLAWFDRISVPAGKQVNVNFTVVAHSMALWYDDGWEIRPGKWYPVYFLLSIFLY